jgi:hypothetical protein
VYDCAPNPREGTKVKSSIKRAQGRLLQRQSTPELPEVQVAPLEKAECPTSIGVVAARLAQAQGFTRGVDGAIEVP